MTIRRVVAQNFKCFKNIDVGLNDFNIVIGANASGKSNFVQIFTFLRDIVFTDLENAISLQGGGEYIRNIKILDKKPMTIGVQFDYSERTAFNYIEEKLVGLEAVSVDYKFSLDFPKNDIEHRVLHDKLTLYIQVHVVDIEEEESEPIGTGKIIIQAFHDKPSVQNPENCKVNVEFIPDNEMPDDVIEKMLGYIRGPFFDEVGIRDLILDSPWVYFPFGMFEYFRGIRIYDFVPKEPKEITSVSAKSTLDKKGGNLAIVLSRLNKNEEEWSRYINMLRGILPFISELEITKLGDKAMLFQLREEYSKKDLLPASMVSDGTVSIIALVYAIYFESGSVAIIEEPERNLHPGLISKLVDMMQDASRGKQIIVTTHNLEVIRNAVMESILFMSRDDKGFTHISKPYEQEHVKAFLEHELGIADLFLDNLLGG